jgi:hypothetical protein
MKSRILIGILLSAITVCAEAQAPRYPTESSKELSEDLQKALREAGIPSPGLVLALGASRDPQYLPLLRKLASGGIHLGEGQQAWAAQMALAKLGQEQELSEIQCEVRQMSNQEARYYAVKEKLPYVGGWFAIRLEADQLTETPDNKRDLSWGDNVVENSQMLAIKVIPDLIPQTIVEPRERFGTIHRQTGHINGLSDKQVIDGWYHWILDHQKELEDLQPTGKQIEYSKTKCDKYFREQAREMKREKPPYR